MSSQRNSRGGGAGSRQQDHRRRAGGRGRRGPRFTGARLGLGVLCILAALGLVYRSVLAGVFKEGAGIGMLGLIPAVLFFFGGVMAIQMRHRAAPVAFLTPFLFCLLADITCLIHASKMNEWKLWAVAAAVLAVLFLVFLCLHRQRGLAVPVVLLVVTVVLTAVVCLLVKGSAAQGNGTQTQSSDGTATDGNAAQTVPIIAGHGKFTAHGWDAVPVIPAHIVPCGPQVAWLDVQWHFHPSNQKGAGVKPVPRKSGPHRAGWSSSGTAPCCAENGWQKAPGQNRI